MASSGSFDIGDFLSKVDNLGGLAKSNRFSVEITPPTSLRSTVQASAINFLAKTVSFPARSFGTTTYRSGGQFGLTVPYETTMEPVSLTMLNTDNQAPRIFWTDWIEYIQHVGSHGYNMQYFKKFIGQVKISYYTEDSNLASPPDAKYQVTLHEAWPKSIGAIEIGWESTEFQDFEVEIGYSRWTEKNSSDPQRTL